jgi:hypothetical protein
MNFRAIGFAIAIGVLTFTHLWSFQAGKATERAAHVAETQKLQRDLFDVADRASEDAAALDALRRETEQAQMEFEDEARRDPDAALRVPGPDSLRRLETLWQRAGATP